MNDASTDSHPEPTTAQPQRDPFTVPQASPRFANPLAAIGFAVALLTLVTGLSPLTGPIGMGIGLVAHLKGSRWGIPAAFASGAAMIAAMAFSMYLR